MTLLCPQCGAVAAETAVDLGNGLARCFHCRTVIDRATGGFAEGFPRVLEERDGILPPPGIRITRALGDPTLEAPVAFGYRMLPAWVLARCLLLLIVLNLIALSGAEEGLVKPVLAADALGAAFLVFKLRDRHRFAVRDETLLVDRPWFPVRRFGRSEIDQVLLGHREVEEYAHGEEVSETYAYDLRLLDRAGRRVPLVSGLASREHAVYVSGWIERRLGIVRTHVDGEFQWA